RRNGLFADFSPKPLESAPGNGFHINFSVQPDLGSSNLNAAIAGILAKAVPMTVFLNPAENSYRRLGKMKAPGFVSWSSENRSQLIRIPAASGEFRRAELRSADPSANPYIAFTLMIRAALYGIENRLTLPAPADFNLYKADEKLLATLEKLPADLKEAKKAASADGFVADFIPEQIMNIYCGE
ncbi:MAG: type I glutamate--ammonia ligase, partial [Clostridia bacterium]|nr:type I glutamate--ammonia ligase [Clostridia bacterium]